jgi:hypothetical protein
MPGRSASMSPEKAPVRRSEPTFNPAESSYCSLPQNEARRNS